MKATIEVNSDSDPKQLCEILNRFKSLSVQLNFEQAKFLELQETLAPFLSAYSQRIKSLKSGYNFEETVSLASRLEDFFDINFQDIIVEPYGSCRHVIELAEFYDCGKDIVVRCNRDKTPNMNTPFAVALLGSSKNIGISYDVTVLSTAWFDRCVLDAMSDYVKEIYMPLREPYMLTKLTNPPDFVTRPGDFRLTVGINPCTLSNVVDVFNFLTQCQLS